MVKATGPYRVPVRLHRGGSLVRAAVYAPRPGRPQRPLRRSWVASFDDIILMLGPLASGPKSTLLPAARGLAQRAPRGGARLPHGVFQWYLYGVWGILASNDLRTLAQLNQLLADGLVPGVDLDQRNLVFKDGAPKALAPTPLPTPISGATQVAVPMSSGTQHGAGGMGTVLRNRPMLRTSIARPTGICSN